MYDVFLICKKSDKIKNFKERFPMLKTAESVTEAQKKSITKFFWVLWPDIILNEDFEFDYIPDDWSQDVVHVFQNGTTYDGVFLIPKKCNITERECVHRFFVKHKKVETIASRPIPFDYFDIDTYEDYQHAIENSSTDLFWVGTKNIKIDKSLVENFYISHHESVDRKQNHAFIHRVGNKDLYNGLFLCSKHLPLTKKEIEYRFPVARKEWNIIGSGPVKYDVFEIDTYEEYLHALETSKTEMFWILPSTVDVDNNFKFNTYFTHDNKFDREINHVYLNGKYHDGVILCSKHKKISAREWHFKFIAAKKEIDEVASYPKPYDIVFISYQEPDADKNFEALKKRFPRAKRIHGIKGIHQAHIEAAKLCTTPMFWIVDGDAQIVDDFNFDYQVPAWQYNHVHVWRSKNPINGLVYGYGGIKLFPTQLTIDMDTSKPDMTTSISDKFVAVKEISNITGFNTGEFETWKSAFRECCKLASKVIDRQKDAETERRLKIWCSIGRDKPFGDYAIAGARAGMAYGSENKGNVEALKKINDFDWLKEKFIGNL